MSDDKVTPILIFLAIIAILMGVCLWGLMNTQPDDHRNEGLTSTATDPLKLSVETTKPTVSGTFSLVNTPGSNTPSPTNAGSGSGTQSQVLTPGTSVVSTMIEPPKELTADELEALAREATAGKCYPKDGEEWSKRGGTQGTLLNSPCCQPPNFEILDKTMGTCANPIGANGKCLTECCQMCNVDRGKYDKTWYDMCMCGCSLCCNNSTDPHFAKHGTCMNYIKAPIGDVRANEAVGMFTPSNWRGYISAFKAIAGGIRPSVVVAGSTGSRARAAVG
jgi:hypothetical protein